MTTFQMNHTPDRPGAVARPPLKFVLSSVQSDSHMWNLVALQLIMEEMGHEVLNLGACVPVERLLAACRDERPDCLVISTINGHGHVDGARVISALRADPELTGLPAVIGGKLGVRGDANSELQAELLALGYDAVFHVGAGDSGQAIESFREFVAANVRTLR
jgi:methylmalonyl-CoA mutase cobalamin-binding subunit